MGVEGRWVCCVHVMDVEVVVNVVSYSNVRSSVKLIAYANTLTFRTLD